MLIFIAAHGINYEMGLDGHLPWRHARLQNDTKRLHLLANKKHLVMGERTYHDYKDVRSAFQTTQVTVLSKSAKKLSDADVVSDIQSVVSRSKTEDLWVIGGGNVFAQLLPYVDIMYLTLVKSEFNADVFFPAYSVEDWIVVSEEHYNADDQNPYPYTFLELKRP